MNLRVIRESEKENSFYWAKQVLELTNREKTISNRIMINSFTLPIYKEFFNIDTFFVASVVNL